MPVPLSLPTTSALSLSASLRSDSHPSLILAAARHRSVLRNVLKQHKRLSPPAQSSGLATVLSAVDGYLPYLFALDAGLSGRAIGGEEFGVVLEREVEVEWRPSLAATSVLPGRKAGRVRGRSLDYELCYVLSTAACARSLVARNKLRPLQQQQQQQATLPSPEQRKASVNAAVDALLEASSMHVWVASRSSELAFPPSAVDIAAATQSALASLALSSATLLAVLKDDPWPSIVAQERSASDREWMIKAPDIPKVRAHLFARLCLQAAEHAGTAHALLLASERAVDRTVLGYAQDLQRTARAKACRFFGIDAEIGSKTGEALGWLLAAKQSLLLLRPTDASSSSSSSTAGPKALSKLKRDWSERREDRKLERGGEWGSDAGRLDESRVVDVLEAKWNKANDLVSHQLVSSPAMLLATMPSGREIHSVRAYVPPSLDADTLARLRAPPEKDAAAQAEGESDDSDEEDGPVDGTSRAGPSVEAYY